MLIVEVAAFGWLAFILGLRVSEYENWRQFVFQGPGGILIDPNEILRGIETLVIFMVIVLFIMGFTIYRLLAYRPEPTSKPCTSFGGLEG